MQVKQAPLSALTIRQDMGTVGDITDGRHITTEGIATTGRGTTGEARL